ncbi:MAG: PRC-barrel domain-containing protein, partial [Syntrophobacteraceae bacterium]
QHKFCNLSYIIQTNKKKTRKEENKMRRNLIIILLAIISLFLGTNGFTQEKKEPVVGDIAGKTAEGQSINAFMVEKIIGSKVINMKGETLGKIENLVIDIDTGRIMYAVLESGGFLNIGDKLFPVPWKSLAALPSEGIFFLNQSKEQMEKAPAFEKKNLPNMTDINWGEGIFKHYAVPGYEQQGTIGMGFDYSYNGYGYGEYPGPEKDPYKTIFDSKTIKTISGQVIKVEQVPEPGFGREIRLTVFIDKKEVLPVYLGPTFYIIDPSQARPFKSGDKVTVTGSQVTDRGEPFMIATTVKRGNVVLRLRDKDGNPEWVGWKKTSD